MVGVYLASGLALWLRMLSVYFICLFYVRVMYRRPVACLVDGSIGWLIDCSNEISRYLSNGAWRI